MKRKTNFTKLSIIFPLLLALVLTACGQSGQASSGAKREDGSKSDLSTNSGNGAATQEISDLQYLCRANGYGCSTENGYYYLTEDPKKLEDGNYGIYLMYMDYATQQEIYLCSNSGCNHNNANCPAVFLYDDFSISTRLFIYKNQLYILSKDPDQDGSMSTSSTLDDDISFSYIEDTPHTLYRAELDGTNRQKIYTFDTVTLEDFVLGDASGIYVVAKKISVTRENGSEYRNSEEKNLLRVDVETKKAEKVCSLDFEDDITWHIQGCFENTLVLEGTDYGRKLTNAEMFDDDAYKNYYLNSSEVYALLDLKTGEKKEALRLSNETEFSDAIAGNKLYYSLSDRQQILCRDLATGEEKEIASLPQSYIYHAMDGVLCCHDWDFQNHTFYYVDINTGEVSHSKLVNKSLGWDLEFRAELADRVLVIYDYDATPAGDGAYEINQYKYALISKEDLYAGNENYYPIKMIEKGEI